MVLNGIPINENQCIGDSLDTINNAFITLSSFKANNLNPVDSPTIDLSYDSSTGVLSATTSVVPIGSVMAFPSTSAPTGWLKLNGTTLSRSVYSSLWTFAQASGNIVTDTAWYSTSATGSFSQGDGSTTFRLPDFRGMFVRSLDDGRGVDFNRTMGTFQRGSVVPVDTSGTYAFYNLIISWYNTVSGGYYKTAANALGLDVAHGYNGDTPPSTTAASFIASDVWMSYESSSGGYLLDSADARNGGFSPAMSRPQNLPLLYCIKF